MRENTWKSQLTLFSLITPLLLGFLVSLEIFDLGKIEISLIFVAAIVIVGMVQVAILLGAARAMVAFFWSFKLDPDDFVLPLLTALGDVVGTGILVGAFYFLVWIGDREMVGEVPDVTPNATDPHRRFFLLH